MCHNRLQQTKKESQRQQRFFLYQWMLFFSFLQFFYRPKRRQNPYNIQSALQDLYSIPAKSHSEHKVQLQLEVPAFHSVRFRAKLRPQNSQKAICPPAFHRSSRQRHIDQRPHPALCRATVPEPYKDQFRSYHNTLHSPGSYWYEFALPDQNPAL